MRCAYFDFRKAWVGRFRSPFLSAWGGLNVRRARGWAALLRVRGPVPHRPALLQTHPGLEVERRGRALGASSGEVDGGGGLG